MFVPFYTKRSLFALCDAYLLTCNNKQHYHMSRVGFYGKDQSEAWKTGSDWPILPSKDLFLGNTTSGSDIALLTLYVPIIAILDIWKTTLFYEGESVVYDGFKYVWPVKS